MWVQVGIGDVVGMVENEVVGVFQELVFGFCVFKLYLIGDFKKSGKLFNNIFFVFFLVGWCMYWIGGNCFILMESNLVIGENGIWFYWYGSVFDYMYLYIGIVKVGYKSVEFLKCFFFYLIRSQIRVQVLKGIIGGSFWIVFEMSWVYYQKVVGNLVFFYGL